MVLIRHPKDPSQPPKEYFFDNVFDANSLQTDVYNQTARGIVNSVLDGYNGFFS